jgi:hypothetical protein
MNPGPALRQIDRLEELRQAWHRATYEERILFLRLIRIEDAQVPRGGVAANPETRPPSE